MGNHVLYQKIQGTQSSYFIKGKLNGVSDTSLQESMSGIFVLVGNDKQDSMAGTLGFKVTCRFLTGK